MKAREAAYEGRLEEARRLLDRARTLCGPDSTPYFDRVEQLIADRQGEQQRRSAGKASEDPSHPETPLGRFRAWVSKFRDAVSESISSPHCAPPGEEDYGFCDANYEGSDELQVRYWAADEQAFRFTLLSSSPLSCQDLGRHREVGRWRGPSGEFQLCELMDHELRSLSALLEHSNASYRLDVFSHAYTERDPKFRQSIEAHR